MFRWRSIRTRLTLLFFAITLAAVGFVYVYLTPQLESSLRSEKLRTLESAANTYSGRLNNPFDLSERQLNSSVRAVAERKLVTGTGRSDDGELGQAAKPLFSNKRVRRVVVFSSPLADVADNVA